MKYHQGFTLIETLFYIMILSVFLSISSALLIQVLQGMQKTDAVYAVNEGGSSAMTRMLTTIRNADSVTLPLQGATSSQLTLTMPGTSSNPTIFLVENEVLKVKEGTAATSTLTAKTIRIKDIVFTNVAATSSPGSIHIDMSVSSTASDIGTGNAPENIFTGSATIRRRL